LRLKIIFPATQADIEDFTRATSVVIRETKLMYKNVTEKIIANTPLSRTKWIRDIFSHSPSSTQAKDIFFENDQFLLVPDTKWDKRSLDELWCLAIVRNSNLRTVRDLGQDQLEELREIQNISLKQIHSKYDLNPNQIVGFIQYLPSFFHLHIHFTHYSKVSSSTRAILLEDIIYNLSIKPDYYQENTLMYVISTNTELYKELNNWNALQ